MKEVKNNDLFRFVQLRTAQATEASSSASSEINSDSDFIFYSKEFQSKLFSELKKLNDEKAPYADLKSACETFKASASFKAGLKELSSPFQHTLKALRHVAQWPLEIDVATAKNNLNELLKISIDDYIDGASWEKDVSSLWDNLFTRVILSQEKKLPTNEWMAALRLFKILQTLKNNNSSFEKLLKAKIVLPSGIFPKANLEKEMSAAKRSTTTASKKDQTHKTKENIQNIKFAIEEMKKQADKEQSRLALIDEISSSEVLEDESLATKAGKSTKTPAKKPKANTKPKPDPWILPKKEFDKMSSNTKKILNDYGLAEDQISIPQAIQFLEKEIIAKGSSLQIKPAKRKVVRIGNRYITVEHHALVTGKPQLENYDGTTDLFDSESFMASVPHGAGAVTPLGIGDLLVVQQELSHYEMGEIAHIENIMKTENKERTHLHSLQQENTFVQEIAREEETKQDLQTTERFELQRETQNTLETDMNLTAGVTIAADYGQVSLDANFGLDLSISTSESETTSTNYARNVVNRSMSRIQESVREERTSRTLESFEEKNVHGFNNSTDNHVIGIYNWVNKIYDAKVVNYGKRLMFEFVVPEPAAFFIHSESTKSVEGIGLEKPEPPELTSHLDITLENYHTLAATYKAVNVTPPPAPYEIISKTISEPDRGEHARIANAYSDLTVSSGYEAKTAYLRYSHHFSGGSGHYFKILIGRKKHTYVYGEPQSEVVPLTHSAVPTGETGVIPLSVTGSRIYNFVLNIEVLCERTDRKFEQWQIATYNAILDGYAQLKSRYEEALNAMQVKQGVQVRGRNPLRNREIERQELKRSCLGLITNQHFDLFNAMQDTSTPHGYPQQDFSETLAEGPYIQFFEQAFEWEQLTYMFYPYFWGRKSEWVNKYAIDDVDPLFGKFLQAGAARVLVPVRPMFNSAVLYFLQSHGHIWNGDDAPLLDDELYLSMAEELANQAELLANPEQVGESWKVTLPTSLVILQQEQTLPAEED